MAFLKILFSLANHHVCTEGKFSDWQLDPIGLREPVRSGGLGRPYRHALRVLENSIHSTWVRASVGVWGTNPKVQKIIVSNLEARTIKQKVTKHAK